VIRHQLPLEHVTGTCNHLAGSAARRREPETDRRFVPFLGSCYTGSNALDVVDEEDDDGCDLDRDTHLLGKDPQAFQAAVDAWLQKPQRMPVRDPEVRPDEGPEMSLGRLSTAPHA
jgi:hypothetical protein